MEKVLTATWDLPNSHTFDVYRENGGYSALRKALTMTSASIIDEVKKADLRGRGGAGFPAGIKWGFLPKDTDSPKYLVINADESEPGTFKDRYIMALDPHRLIEGCIITSWALDIHTCYIYIRGEFKGEMESILEDAIAEAYEAGFLGETISGKPHKLDIYLHFGAGAYICGEETGLLESLEGKAGQPRLKPPYPAIIGLFDCPTIINNVETIACVPSIISNGGAWFKALGNDSGGGPKIYCISGHVNKPGVFEDRTGITLEDVIFKHGGGLPEGREIKCVIPGGSSCPCLTKDEIEGVTMDVNSMRDAGTMLGTAGVCVVDDQTCIVRLAARTAHFYAHESCGQCTPCRTGTGWAERILNDIEAGRGTQEDIDLLLEVANNVEGTTICALGDAMAMPIRSFVVKFEEEFRKHVELGGCPFPAW